MKIRKIVPDSIFVSTMIYGSCVSVYKILYIVTLVFINDRFINYSIILKLLGFTYEISLSSF